jgi:actin-related protein
MTAQVENQVQTPENKPNDKELNFRALEAKYQRQLEQERSARLEAERIAQEVKQKTSVNDDSDDDSEPYVDHKKLKREQAKFGQQLKQDTQSEIQRAVSHAISEERKQNWIKSNPDFYEVLQHADKFAAKDPELAEAILEMPDTFERQKLVYKNIKAFGVHKPEQKQSTIQEKVDANRRSPYYQPSGVGASPYASLGDFSQSGQKNAYEKMKSLITNVRL